MILIKISRLIINEHIKLYKQKLIWLIYIIVTLSLVLIGVLNKFLPQFENKAFNNNWDFVIFNKNLITLISLFILTVGAGIVSKEFSDGTIKILLIKPMKRWKIVLAKYITVIIFALELIIYLYIISNLVGSILYGFDGLDYKFNSEFGFTFFDRYAVLYTIELYLISSISIIVWLSFSFMLSTIIKNSGIAVGLSLLFMLTGNTITTFMVYFDIDWVRYLVFANTDLLRYLRERPLLPDMTLEFSVIILILYIVIFNLISFFSFSKKEI
jgi:ABC-2 type transport system permease protein